MYCSADESLNVKFCRCRSWAASALIKRHPLGFTKGIAAAISLVTLPPRFGLQVPQKPSDINR